MCITKMTAFCIWNAEENDLSKQPRHKGKSQSHWSLETPESLGRSRRRIETNAEARTPHLHSEPCSAITRSVVITENTNSVVNLFPTNACLFQRKRPGFVLIKPKGRPH